MAKFDERITAVYADEDGNILDAAGLGGMGRTGRENVPLTPDDLIPLPETADLMLLPDHQAVGRTAEGEVLPIAGLAVAAILPAGYTRLYLPAYVRDEGAERLPLYGYTAVVVYHDELCCAAVYTDENDKWDPAHYNTPELKKLVKRTKKDLPGNRLVEHLGHCSLTWHCCTAQNLFYRRWECGIPVSPVCNANCFGCISLQPAECCPSPQSRITFRPTPEEVAEIGVYHLSVAPDGIVSFGQGCEGEPSLAADTIAAGIRLIRECVEIRKIRYLRRFDNRETKFLRLLLPLCLMLFLLQGDRVLIVNAEMLEIRHDAEHRLARRGHADAEHTFSVGDGPRLGSHQGHGNTNQGLFLRVGHHTRHLRCLCRLLHGSSRPHRQRSRRQQGCGE